MIFDVPGWVQRRYPGFDGQFEAYCWDNAVSLVGRVIEGELSAWDEVPGPGRSNKQVRRYKSVKEIFAVIDSGVKQKTAKQRSVDALIQAGLSSKVSNG